MKESTVKTSLYHRNGNEKRESNDGVFQLSGGFKEEKRVLKDVSMKKWLPCGENAPGLWNHKSLGSNPGLLGSLTLDQAN